MPGQELANLGAFERRWTGIDPRDITALEGFVRQARENLKLLKFDNVPEDAESLEEYPMELSGRIAFRLYDTFGMPLDFIRDACRDRGIPLDESGFDHAMQEQKSRARASWKGAAKQTANPAVSATSRNLILKVITKLAPTVAKS